MRMDRADQVVERESVHDGDGELGDQVRRVRADEERAHHAASRLLGGYFHEAGRRIHDERLAVRAKHRLAGDEQVRIQTLGTAHGGDLGVRVDAGRNDGKTDRGLDAGDRLHDGDGLGFGDMRKLDARGDVPHGVDVRHGGAEGGIDLDPLPDLHADGLEPQALDGGAAANGNQNQIGGDDGRFAAQPVVDDALLETGDLGAGDDLHAELLEGHAQMGGGVAVEVREDARQRLDDRDFAPQGGEEGGELAADHAAANDRDALRVGGGGQHAVRIHRELDAGNRELRRLGTGGDQDVVGLKELTVPTLLTLRRRNDLHGRGGDEAGGTGNDGD